MLTLSIFLALSISNASGWLASSTFSTCHNKETSSVNKLRLNKSKHGHHMNTFLINVSVCNISISSESSFIAPFREGRISLVYWFIEDVLRLPELGLPASPSRDTTGSSPTHRISSGGTCIKINLTQKVQVSQHVICWDKKAGP